MEADDLGTYVVKFRGAGQGRKALIAEIISAGLARACGLLVPDLVTVEVDPAMAPGEPDQEIQDLLRASGGLNWAWTSCRAPWTSRPPPPSVDAALAGKIMWFDALVGNADLSWRNPNMLLWHGSLYLIDHGATLTFQHRWASAASAAARPYDASDHALAGCGALVQDADAAWRRGSARRYSGLPCRRYRRSGRRQSQAFPMPPQSRRVRGAAMRPARRQARLAAAARRRGGGRPDAGCSPGWSAPVWARSGHGGGRPGRPGLLTGEDTR